MDSARVLLSIRLRDDSGDTVVFVNAALDTLLQDLVGEVLRRLRIHEPPSEWGLAYGGVSVPLDMPVGSLCERFTASSEATAAIELEITRTDSAHQWGDEDVLYRKPSDFEECDFSKAAEECADLGAEDSGLSLEGDDRSVEISGVDLGKVGDSIAFDDGTQLGGDEFDSPQATGDASFFGQTMAEEGSSFESEAGSADGSAEAISETPFFAWRQIAGLTRSPVTRQSTVRYFSKMNPDRVYPLLVTITERRLEKVRIAGVRQATSAEFQVQVDMPIEIEPIIPGCECYPQRITVIAGKGDFSARFHVVPSAVGRIDGATVVIRQSHVILSQVPLEVTVIPQTHAIMSAAMTFAAPSLSAAMDHFGLDFQALPGQGNLYLSVAHLLFDQISPLTLTLALGVVTSALAWHAWPRSRDVFWEVQARSPAERLRAIAQSGRADLSSYRDLVELIQDSPELLQARLLKARLDHHADRDKAALNEYLAAFKLGAASVDDYQSAYELAWKQSDPQLVLSVLQCADQSLAPHAMPSRMIYNLACFQARCGQEDDAMRSLRRAFAAGYNKINRARTDSDLRKLWSRDDFQALLHATTDTRRHPT